MNEHLWQERLAELAEDRISGAREILGRLLRHLKGGLEGRDDAACARLVLEAAQAMVPRQPTMAPLLHVFDELFRAATTEGGCRSALDRLIVGHGHALQAILAHAGPAMAEHRRIATLSWSSSVARILEASKPPLTLFVAESRPGCEGRRAAARAAAMGHEVVFHADSAFPSAAAACELLLLGGDALSPLGLVNKVGSLPAARACGAVGVPVVAVLDDTKVVGRELAERLRVLPENPAEVWDAAPSNIRVECRYFELVPLRLIDRVWSEAGITSADELLARVAGSAPATEWREIPLPETGAPLGAATHA